MKKLIIAMICVVLAVAVGLVALMGVAIARGTSGMSIFSGIVPEAELARRQTFSAEGLSQVSIDYSSDDILLYTAPGDEVVLEEYMSNWDDSMLARVQQAGGALRIEQGARPFTISLGINISYVKLYLPASWRGELAAGTTSGSVKCEDDLELASLKATSSSGSVQLANVECAGAVWLEATSGSVHAGRVTAGESAVLYSSSGSVNADGVTAAGEVRAKANSGSIRLGGVAGTSVNFKSSSGSIRCDSIDAGTIEVENSSGGIHIGNIRGIFHLSSHSGTVEVEGGEGGGSASASSGSVKVTLETLMGDLELTTTSGSVRLELGQANAFNFEAKTNSGSIRTPFDNSLSYNKDGNRATGSVGASPVYTVRCEASSGSVKVEWL